MVTVPEPQRLSIDFYVVQNVCCNDMSHSGVVLTHQPSEGFGEISATERFFHHPGKTICSHLRYFSVTTKASTQHTTGT